MSDTRNRPADRAYLAGVLFALPFLLAGGWLAGVGLGWIPYDPAKVHAPGWIIAICGLMFMAGGVATLLVIIRPAKDASLPIIGLVILIGLTIVGNWVAFGAGERNFTRTTSINGVTVSSGPVDERTGRVAFGVGAIILDIVLVALVFDRLRKRR